MELSNLSIRALDKPKEFQLLNPFNGYLPMTDEKGNVISFKVFSLSSEKAQNIINELKREEKEIDNAKILAQLTDSISGSLEVNGEKITKKNVIKLYQWAQENEEFSWILAQIMGFISKGDYTPEGKPA